MPQHLLSVTFLEWCILVTPPLVVLFYLKNIFFDGRGKARPCSRCARRRERRAPAPLPEERPASD